MSREFTVSQAPSKATPVKTRTWWIYNILVTAVAFVVMYELFPHFTQLVVFRGLLHNGWYLVPAILIGLSAYGYFARNRSDFLNGRLGKHRRTISSTVFAAVCFVLWTVGVYAITDYFTYRVFANGFVSRDGLIASDPAFVRFTPHGTACPDMANSISTTGEQVICDYQAPIITVHGFGYVAPIVPNGLFNTFWMQNPGYMLLEDAAAMDDDATKRLVRIDQPQYYGVKMEWTDNLQYVLAKTDFFATFEDPHYLALDPARPHVLTAVVPKIKYAYLWRLPYWGGVVLVHSDGTVEDLTAEQAKADARLKGQWIYPMSLAKHYIEVQNYQLGWGVLTPYVYVPGKLEVEELEGDNQFPFLTRGVDGNTYLVTATKGQGSARGLLRMYFVDASTGTGSYHQFGKHELAYGPGAAMDRITNLPTYQWRHGSGEKAAGNMIVTEPVYVVRPHDPKLYWKFTITNVKNAGISATVVVDDARPDTRIVLKDRRAFEAWLRGEDSAVKAVSNKELVRLIEELGTTLESLKKEAEALGN